MSNFIVDSSRFGGVQRQIGFLISQLGVSTSTTGTSDQWEKKVNEILFEEITPRDEKMTSYLYGINVEIKETVVGLCSVGIWTGSPKIYSSSSDASNALNIFGDARRSSEDQVLSVIVSAAATGSSTGLNTTGSVAIGATEYIDVPVGAQVKQSVFNSGIGTYEQVASGIVGVNTGNFLLIRNVTGQFISTSTVSISTTGGSVGFQTFTFPSQTGFVGITSIRTDLIRVKMYDAYEPSYNVNLFPKNDSTEVGLTSSNVGVGYTQFYYTNGYNPDPDQDSGFVNPNDSDSDDPFYYDNTLIGPTISDEQTFPRIDNSKMAKVVYTTDNTTNNNQITSLVSGMTTFRVGIPTYLTASCTIKEYKTEIQDIVWAYKKGASMTSTDAKSKYQSYFDAMDQGDPEMDVNVPPAPPPDPPRTPDDDEVDV